MSKYFSKKVILFTLSVLLFLIVFAIGSSLMLKAGRFNSKINRFCVHSGIDNTGKDGDVNFGFLFVNSVNDVSRINSIHKTRFNAITFLQSKEDWLAHKILGKTFPWDTNRVVGFQLASVNSAMFNEVHQFPELRYLQLTNTPSTIEQLSKLAELKHLKVIKIINCGLRDEGMQHLIEKLNLQEVDIKNEPLVTDKLIQFLFRSSIIKNVNLYNLTNPRFATLEELFPVSKSIEQLSLGGDEKTFITDKFIKKLSGNTHLKKLDIYNSSLTDKSISDLMKLTGLEVLEIRESNLTYGNIKKLAALPNLKSITIWINSPILDVDMASLNKIFHKCGEVEIIGFPTEPKN